MKLLIYSDLHLEFAPFDPGPVSADLVILAGDIHTGLRGIEWAKQAFPDRPVIYLFGNHEYYGKAMPRLAEKAQEAISDSSVIHLDRTRWDHHGVRFLGCTLWTDFQLQGDQARAMYDAGEKMTDFKRIRVSPKYRRFRPGDALAEHVRSVNWLRKEFATPFDGPTVVITHHAPSARSLPPGAGPDALSPAYASNLDDLVESSGAALWVHGHIHSKSDYLIGKTRVICNPRGYPDEPGQGFDPGLIIDV